MEVLENSTYFEAVWKELAEHEQLILATLAETQSQWNMPVSRTAVDGKVRGLIPQDRIDQTQ